MQNNKRSLLAIFLSGLVLLVYYSFFFKPPVSTTVTTSSLKTESSPSPEVAPSSALSLPEGASSFVSQKSLIQTPLYQVEQESLGGTVQKMLLQNYRETTDKKSPSVNLIKEEASRNLLVRFKDSNLPIPERIPFQIVKSTDKELEYIWTSPNLKITQKIEWEEKNYVAHLKVELENLSPQPFETSVGLLLEAIQHPHQKKAWSFLEGPQNQVTPLSYKDGTVSHHIDLTKIPSQTEEIGAFQWAGLEDRYFLWGILSRGLSPQTKIEYGKKDSLLFLSLFYPKDRVISGGKIEKDFSVYIGPKEFERLKQLNVQLEKAIDYGWFGVVAHPILFLLNLFHKLVQNWGVAIILLTLFIKLMLHPVNKRSLDSMKAMQSVQPKLAELREKYKDDRERLNSEMMALFRANKVNPMGGCLPMVLQMPIYIALYKVLYNAVELYHAPFFGFYKDLSAPDPYFILPILLAIFMVLQQKLTPTTQDPSQAKMMMFMPVIFSVFMLFLPVGLVVYIFVNTVITVVQQYLHSKGTSVVALVLGKKKQ